MWTAGVDRLHKESVSNGARLLDHDGVSIFEDQFYASRMCFVCHVTKDNMKWLQMFLDLFEEIKSKIFPLCLYCDMSLELRLRLSITKYLFQPYTSYM